MIHEFPQSLMLPRGLVTVDLINERGKVVQREQAENFISLQAQETAKWWQRMMWGAYSPNEINDAFGNKPSEAPWFPANHIAAWTDATAEAPSTELGMRGDVIAWASRHPVGSPTGKRGVVDIGGSEFKDAYAKWMFNWTTSQGNGTFQSVGWARINENNGYMMPYSLPPGSVLFTNAGNTGLGNGPCSLWWDATNSVWNITEWVTATSQVRIVSVPAAGGTTTQLCLLPVNAWTSSIMPMGLAKIGTDFIVCGGSGSTSYLRRYTSAGVQSWQRNGDVAFQFIDCTIDGSGNIWTMGNDGKMRRHNPADGTITSTVTITGVTTTAGQGIVYDPADGNFWVTISFGVYQYTLVKVTSAGVVIPSVGGASYLYAALGGASSAPWAGTYAVPGHGLRDPYTLTLSRTSAIAGSEIARTTAIPLFLANVDGRIAMKDGAVWGSGSRSVAVGGALGAQPLTLANGEVGLGCFASRSRLSSPVTKDSSKSMKITYQFDFS